MDRELLEAVLGRKTPDLTFLPGWLTGYAVETAAGYSFPTLVERRAGRADGILTRGLTPADIDRIAYFEDTTEYAPIVLDVATSGPDVSAQVFVATKTLKSTGERWNFDDWSRKDKPLLVEITHRVMREHYGVTPAAEIDAVWHRIKAEIEAAMHAPVALKPKRPSRTSAGKQTTPRRATSTRRPRKS